MSRRKVAKVEQGQIDLGGAYGQGRGPLGDEAASCCACQEGLPAGRRTAEGTEAIFAVAAAVEEVPEAWVKARPEAIQGSRTSSPPCPCQIPMTARKGQAQHGHDETVVKGEAAAPQLQDGEAIARRMTGMRRQRCNRCSPAASSATLQKATSASVARTSKSSEDTD